MIPTHLRDFPRDERGLPVTWASAWTSETQSPPILAPEPLLPDNPTAIFTQGEQGYGDHLFPLPSDAIAVTSDDCYTPRWVFDAMGLEFDLDVAAGTCHGPLQEVTGYGLAGLGPA